MTWRALSVVGWILVGGLLGTGCSLPAPPCDLVIAGVEEPGLSQVPNDAVILATSSDVDPAGWRASDPGVGGGAVAFRLRPEAAERLAAHTTANIGRSLVIAVGDVVVAAPVISGPIEGGTVEISGRADEDIVAAFAPCLPIEIRPPG